MIGEYKFSFDGKTVDPDSYYKDCVVFNTYSAATQAVLELLGTRINFTPVIMPINISPEVMAAVLRSGASPYLLDIDVLTMQLDATQLQTALGELETAIVILTMPGGQLPDPAILDLVKDLPTIVDTRLCPPKLLKKNSIDPCKSLGSFTIYDLSSMCGGGGVVHHAFDEQRKVLRGIRSGPLGNSTYMSWPQTEALSKHYASGKDLSFSGKAVASYYIHILKQTGNEDMIMFDTSFDWPYFLIKVGSVEKAIAHLHSYQIEARFGCFPLHFLDTLKARWTEDPEYGAAELMHSNILALPIRECMELQDVKMIINALLEVKE